MYCIVYIVAIQTFSCNTDKHSFTKILLLASTYPDLNGSRQSLRNDRSTCCWRFLWAGDNCSNTASWDCCYMLRQLLLNYTQMKHSKFTSYHLSLIFSASFICPQQKWTDTLRILVKQYIYYKKSLKTCKQNMKLEISHMPKQKFKNMTITKTPTQIYPSTIKSY